MLVTLLLLALVAVELMECCVIRLLVIAFLLLPVGFLQLRDSVVIDLEKGLGFFVVLGL